MTIPLTKRAAENLQAAFTCSWTNDAATKRLEYDEAFKGSLDETFSRQTMTVLGEKLDWIKPVIAILVSSLMQFNNWVD